MLKPSLLIGVLLFLTGCFTVKPEKYPVYSDKANSGFVKVVYREPTIDAAAQKFGVLPTASIFAVVNSPSEITSNLEWWSFLVEDENGKELARKEKETRAPACQNDAIYTCRGLTCWESGQAASKHCKNEVIINLPQEIGTRFNVTAYNHKDSKSDSFRIERNPLWVEPVAK
jgi:hypothetical protein